MSAGNDYSNLTAPIRLLGFLLILGALSGDCGSDEPQAPKPPPPIVQSKDV